MYVRLLIAAYFWRCQLPVDPDNEAACLFVVRISQTYDDATHPADITLEWVVCDSYYCDYDVPVPSPIMITCAGESFQPRFKVLVWWLLTASKEIDPYVGMAGSFSSPVPSTAANRA